MSIQAAFEALKNRDFVTARSLMGREDLTQFAIQHFLIKGLAEIALEDWIAAKATFIAATHKFPEHALFWLNLGVAEENLGLFKGAITSQEQCLILNPSQAEAYGNLSNLYRKVNRFVDAEIMARSSLTHGAPCGQALNCLGLALQKQGKFADAETNFLRAQREEPSNPVFLANAANLAVDQLHFDKAWILFAKARAIRDDAVFRHDEGLARLLAGDYHKGFALFESRLEMPNMLRLKPTCPRWHGEELKNKKLLIIAEQGFGDTIQFMRYQKFIPDGELIWAVPKSLIQLMANNIRGTVIDETSQLPPCDFYVPIISLAIETDHVELYKTGPYLEAPLTPALPSISTRKKIGLVWAGSPTHGRDSERSIPLNLFNPLFAQIEADFYAPVIGEALEQVKQFPLISLGYLIKDFSDTAALLKQLDYLITVDTSVAHLAGALGIPTFLLISHCPDWRWGINGDKSSLYPSLKLLRQPQSGDWASVIKTLISLLKSGF